MNIAIFDLEGTISNHDHRKHFFDQQNYKSYNELFYQDTVNETVLDQIHFFKDYCQIYILTAKESKWRPQVLNWLLENAVPYHELIMRPVGNTQPSAEWKRSKVQALSNCHDIEIAVDDRQEIIDAYLSLGVFAIYPFSETEGGNNRSKKDSSGKRILPMGQN